MEGEEQGLPPIGILLVLVILAYLMFMNMEGFDSAAIIGLISVLGVVGITGYSYYLAKNDGIKTTYKWLIRGKHGKKSSSRSSSKSEKVSSPSQSTKNELYFERANQRCEWCDNRTDNPETHHITSRAEGGTNNLSNLIVLCPSCHRKADNGAIPKNKLEYKVKKQMEDY